METPVLDIYMQHQIEFRLKGEIFDIVRIMPIGLDMYIEMSNNLEFLN